MSDILAGVLKVEPDFTLLPQSMNPRLDELLPRCLDKNPKNRWQAVGDLRIEIVTVASQPYRQPDFTTARKPRQRPLERLWMAGIGVLLITSAALAVAHFREAAQLPPSEIRVEINTPPTPAPGEFALSPDGNHLVFVPSGGVSRRLWLRALDKSDAQPIGGTDCAQYPFWSPDSRSIGFFVPYKLYRVDIAGGPPQFLANVRNG